MSCSLKIVEKWLPATGAISFAQMSRGNNMSVQAEVQAPILNAGHRCDACAASRAYVAVILKWSPTLRNGGELLFCAHCFRKSEHALQPYIAQLIDERYTLTKHATDDGGPR